MSKNTPYGGSDQPVGDDWSDAYSSHEQVVRHPPHEEDDWEVALAAAAPSQTSPTPPATPLPPGGVPTSSAPRELESTSAMTPPPPPAGAPIEATKITEGTATQTGDPQGPVAPPLLDTSVSAPTTPTKTRRWAITPKGKTRSLGASAPPQGNNNRRWVVFAARASVWVVLAIVAIVGVRGLLTPPGVSDAQFAEAAAEYGLSDFPAQAAMSTAVAFTQMYFTPIVDDSRATEQQLRTLAYPKTAETIARQPLTRYRIIAGPFPLASPSLIPQDPNRGFVTTATYLQTPTSTQETENGEEPSAPNQPQWVHLQIPIFASPDGATRVAGTPAFVPAPSPPDGSPGLTFSDDAEAARELRPDLQQFFQAWAVSDEELLTRFISPAAAASVTAGMQGIAGTPEVRGVRVEAAQPGTPRFAEVSVLWNQPDGSRYAQSYQLIVTEDTNGNWLISNLIGGSFAG